MSNCQDERNAKADTVVGLVSYDVKVECPHCKKQLHLNRYPYNDDQTDYCPTEDNLGLSLFGTYKQPAKWDGLSIEYQCNECKEHFYVGSLAI